MTIRRVRIAIVGAGSAGLTAMKTICRVTDDFLLIDRGPLGTTCARVGCMPSKALLIVAADYHRRHHMARGGILGTEALRPDLPAVMAHVRRLRDRFAAGPAEAVRDLGERFLCGEARLLGPDRLQVGEQIIEAQQIILATGSRPRVPAAWQPYREHLLTSDTLFEQPDLPGRLAVVGLGGLGVELGQALARLGCEVHAFGQRPEIAGLTHPDVAEAARSLLGRELQLHLGARALPIAAGTAGLTLRAGDAEVTVDKALLAIGRVPNLESLQLEAAGLTLDARGLPTAFDPITLRVDRTPILLAGDLNGVRPLLHEASDEGRIAAHQALGDLLPFSRRVPLSIFFCEPNIARIGEDWQTLAQEDVVVCGTDYANQGRAIMEGTEGGLLRVMVCRRNACLRGVEMIAPEAGHLAHSLAWMMQARIPIHEILQMPFYHPTLEEGLRSALQGARRQLESSGRVPHLPLARDAADWTLGAGPS